MGRGGKNGGSRSVVRQRQARSVKGTVSYGRSEAVRRALQLFQKDRGSEALEIIDAHIAGRHDSGALLLKANMLQTFGRFEAAERAYLQLVRWEPESATALVELADYYSVKGDLARARRIYMRALSAMNGWQKRGRGTEAHVAATRGMARIEMKWGKLKMAIRRLAKAIGEGPWEGEMVGDLCSYYQQHLEGGHRAGVTVGLRRKRGRVR